MANIQTVYIENDDVDIQIAILYKDPSISILYHFCDLQKLDRIFQLFVSDISIALFVYN